MKRPVRRPSHWLLAGLFALFVVPMAAAQPTDERVDRLDGLARLWGIAKFFHPGLAGGGAGDAIDWDKALIEAIPKVEAAATPEEFRAALDGMLSALHDPGSRTIDPTPAGEQGEHAGAPKVEWVTEGEKKIAVISARDWTAIARSPGAFGPGIFAPLYAQCGDAAGIIIDLRRTSPAGSVDADQDAYIVGTVFEMEAPGLSGGSLTLPAQRSRYHSGYAPYAGRSSGGYYSGFQVTEHRIAQAPATAAGGKPIAILTNETSRELGDVVAALQGSGIATVIHEGDPTKAFDGGLFYSMQMPMGVAVRLRTADMVCADGSIGFEPAIVVKASAADEAMTKAREIATGKAPPAPTSRARGLTAAHALDKSYPGMAYPSREYRLLALFRAWTVLKYFFPYHQHTDAPWDGTLREFIPKFEAAKDAAEYGLAIRELIAHLQDSHVGASGGEASSQSREALGAYLPRALVWPVRGEPVIVKVMDDSKEILAGDVILDIDGKPAEEVRTRFAKFSADSTRQSMLRKIDPMLLRGPKDTDVAITVRGLDGTARKVTLKRAMSADDLQKAYTEEKILQHPAHEVFEVLPEGFGYFDLVKLEQGQVEAAFEKVKDTKALIMDMRGYPRGTAWQICARLTSERMVMAKFTRPYITTPNPDEQTSFAFDQPIYPSPLWKYAGKIVVLIDERAVSQSEHSCMGFEEAAKGRITFMGSPTTGANGDVTNLILPGNVRVSFSGHNVRHADGRQLQRIGIQPDLKVEPTIQGLLEGKDEVLAAAVEFLKKN